MSFRDTFNRDETSDTNFDDYAFLFFAGAVLSVVGVVAAYNFVYRIMFASAYSEYPEKSQKGKVIKYCETEEMKKRVEVSRAAYDPLSFLKSFRGVLFALFLVVVWSLVCSIAMQMGDSATDIKSFDPYRILNIHIGATEMEIKKAYRKMSLIYHPDRNPNDPLASANFIQIAKAYSSLTDETARKNYEKYGNPDGPQTMKVGIGLPRFFLVKENQVLILFIFFLILLVIVPMIFILYYQKQKGFASSGVLFETLKIVSHLLTEGTKSRNCPEMIACSAESRQMKLSPLDDLEMAPIILEVEELKKPQFSNQPIIVRNRILLLAHMQRLHRLLTRRLADELNFILKFSMKIVQSMIEISIAKESLSTAMSMMEFSKCLVQGMTGKKSVLLQVPHFDEEILRHYARGGGAGSSAGASALRDFVTYYKSFPDSDVSKIKGFANFSEIQLKDISSFVSHIGDTKIACNIFVEDETEIVQGDIGTCQVKLERNHLKENEVQGPVHAPLFPIPKYEEWWIFLVDSSNGRILGFDRLKSPEREVVGNIKFRLDEAGNRNFHVHAMNDSVFGLDYKLDVSVKILKESEIKREIFIHPEDADLDKHPTLFEQVLGASATNQDEDEEDEEDEDSNNREHAKKNAAIAISENIIDDEDD